MNPRHSDLFQFAGHLVFKCDILVPDTSWRLSLTHKMFDFADGCEADPLETIDRMRANFSQYALARLQRPHGKRPHSDDFEMVAANLRYDILPPPVQASEYRMLGASGAANTSARSAASSHLNCWRKPRVGSLARLSCAPPAGVLRGSPASTRAKRRLKRPR